MFHDFEKHGFKMNVLVIDNDPDVDEHISTYIDKHVTDPHIDFQFLTDLKNQPLEKIKQAFEDNNKYIFSTTFNIPKQNETILKLIGSQEEPKGIYIHYLSNDLYHGLAHALPDGFDPRKFGFDKHTIYGIHRQTLTKENPKAFFKELFHYFDTVKYYWNDEVDLYMPERPNCFYNTNLKSVYKYKPIWISKDAEFTD